jgi:hypothetical protein
MKDSPEISSFLFRSHVQATGIEGALTAAISTPRFLKLVFREGIVARHDSAFFQYFHAPSRAGTMRIAVNIYIVPVAVR